MGGRYKSTSCFRHVIYEGDVLNTGSLVRKLTIAEAFNRVMALCAYEPVWEEHDSNLVLRFRYLDGPYEGQLVGDQPPVPIIEEHVEQMRFGIQAARDSLMRHVLSLGFKGWYGMREETYDLHHSAASNRQRSQLGA